MSYINSDTWFCLAFQFWLAAFLPGSSDIWRSQIVVVLVVRVLFDFTTRNSHSGSEESNKMQNVHLFCNHLLMKKCILFFSQLVFVSTMKIYQVLSFYEVLWKQGGEKKKVAKKQWKYKIHYETRDVLAPIGIKRKNFIDWERYQKRPSCQRPLDAVRIYWYLSPMVGLAWLRKEELFHFSLWRQTGSGSCNGGRKQTGFY